MRKQKEDELRQEIEANGYGWVNGSYIKPPEEYRLLDRELSCISMIDSILCYNCRGWQDAERVLAYEESSYHNYLADYVELFGRDKVIELIQGQIDSIESVTVGVYTDNEGLTYNSINYKN
jgi:hypothetical protein